MDCSQVTALLAKTSKASEAGQFGLYETTRQSRHVRQSTAAWPRTNDLKVSNELSRDGWRTCFASEWTGSDSVVQLGRAFVLLKGIAAVNDDQLTRNV
jgi:hypothetical protein